MTGNGGRPFVAASALSEGFWAAAAENRLVVQRCDECATLRHYPQFLCPRCRSAAWNWAEMSGRGVVYSFTVSHRAFAPAWADRVPYVIATVELDEGVRMVSDLPPEDLDAVAIGRAVQVFFDHTGAVSLPRFRLVREDQS
ncbi:Zn-ribbon domain-containing OB-fold protein [Mycobacterium sp. 94-17]|uniref:Zn-ribbon domain-containing OB-fold protein n=1 Tax=Mycobacterium sp. 94-17 TaxID=2986147 RepID=UPI002D1F979F|nr:Zn-ribbon domain-containing OB-fold protein [Mycobacterium sp. 94-17]MEB4209765.1 Zn-ribbon domain-containing OB-fold protein [Mycobacterium sp. 94-17]